MSRDGTLHTASEDEPVVLGERASLNVPHGMEQRRRITKTYTMNVNSKAYISDKDGQGSDDCF